ncbi:MAG: PQQ-binding-like beta-propeller repeat protein, partial [Marinisporobacter sp.]|nr:PQQ-binding-like beta-propeller repeat protein [Marinisporobacter sp.]
MKKNLRIFMSFLIIFTMIFGNIGWMTNKDTSTENVAWAEESVSQAVYGEVSPENIYAGTEVSIKLNNINLKDIKKIKYTTDIPGLRNITTTDIDEGTIKFTIPEGTKAGEYHLRNGETYKIEVHHLPPPFPTETVEVKVDDLPEIKIHVKYNGEDTQSPVITLKGEGTQVVRVGQPYRELGVTIVDNVDKDIKVNITYTKDGKAIEKIDTSKAGSYLVHYNAQDMAGNIAKEVIRTINVKVLPSNAPVIQLKGDKEISIGKGSVYKELGVIVTDDMDKNLKAVVTYTKNGETVNEIDTNIEGEYIVHYNIEDFSGNKAVEVTRKVVVVAVSGVDFTANHTSIEALTAIRFNGLYDGEVTSWQWDFDNDGTVDATGQNPQYLFVKPGNYTVKLTVNGEKNKVKENYIIVKPHTPSKTGNGWLDSKNGIHNNGITDERAPISENPETAWTANLGGGWMGGSLQVTPLVVNNYLYAMGNDGKVTKLDRITGKKIWASSRNGNLIMGTPAYGNGKIFVPADNGRICALDAETGKELWKIKAVEKETNCPIIYKDGLVYTGSWDSNGKYACVTEDGKIVWKYDGSFYWAGATIIKDKIIFGGESGNLIVLDRFTGKEIQKINIGQGSIRTSINYVEDQGKLYFGTIGSKLVSLEVSEDGTINRSATRIVNCGAQVTSTPVACNGRIYVGTGGIDSNAGFKVIDEKDFEIIYTVKTDAGIQGGPVLTTAYATKENKHTVYIYFTQNGRPGPLTCIKDFEGNMDPQKIFKYTPPQAQYCIGAPSIYDGYIYYGNDSGNVFALKCEQEAKDTIAPVISTDLENRTVSEAVHTFTVTANDDVDGKIIPVVKMNDQLVKGKDDSYTVTLNDGPNKITVEATDQAG